MRENSIDKDKLWTIPNVITFSRIVLIFPIIYYLQINTLSSNTMAFFLIGVSYFTDFLDGFFARILNSRSRVGQLLDPMADKMLAVAIVAVLYIQRWVPFHFLILVIARDLIISIGALYMINTKKIIMLPLIIGKITTFALGVVFTIIPLSKSSLNIILPEHSWIVIVSISMLVTSLLLIISGLLYIYNYYRQFIIKKTT